MVELAVEEEVNLQRNKFDEWKNRNLGFSLKVEEKALIWDKFIVFGTSVHGSWFWDSPEKFGTVGIFADT